VKLPTYPKYRASGVEWLGDVPEHWEVKPLKHFTDFINGAPFKPEDWSQDGVPIIRIENLNGGDNFNGYEGSVRQRYHVNKGDLLFGWSGNRGTSFGPFLWPREGLHYLNQHIFRLEQFSCDRSWFYWSLKAVTKTIEDEAHGIIGMVHVTKGKLGAVKIPSLPFVDQQAIAAFLDRETERVDQLVAKKRELIERLKEKRIALISRTVTRGLPPAAARAAGLAENPPLKPSGLEWLGDIPAHWEVKRFRRLIMRLDQGWSPNANNYPAATDELGVLKLSSVSKGCFYSEENKALDEIPEGVMAITPAVGDLLISRGNTPDLVGDNCVVNRSYPNLIIPDLIYRLRLQDGTDVSYVSWFLLSRSGRAYIESDARGSNGSMVKLGQGHVRGWGIPFPPLPEQTAIAAYLVAETVMLDRLAAKVELAVERLQEYRTALITAAVTGKIDVRGSVATRPSKQVISRTL